MHRNAGFTCSYVLIGNHYVETRNFYMHSNSNYNSVELFVLVLFELF